MATLHLSISAPPSSTLSPSSVPLFSRAQVRTWKMHLYTMIQVTCVGLLFGLKLTKGGMLYPIAIVLLVPLKWLLGKIVFRKDEIEAVSLQVAIY